MGRGIERIQRALTALIVIASVALPGAAGAQTAGPCTSDGGSGGDWPHYGGDLTGARHQTAEDLISKDNVANLKPVWIAGPSGTSTPVASGRCVYAADSSGRITAWDIQSGAQVWTVQTGVPNGGGNGVLYGLAVDNGRVHVNVQYTEYPRSLAFDANTGRRLWVGERIEFGYEAWQVSNAVPFNGMSFQATTGPDADPQARPGYAILDAATGATLHKQTTIPVRDLDDGYAGGGIWATPVVDLTTNFAFVGTANPYSKKKEHRYDNAILKIDVDRTRATFGGIVDAYKGDIDQYYPGLDRQPVCDATGDQITYHTSNFSLTCVQFDIDFGASPTLFRDKNGELIVGELQKSGTVHAVYADTMQQAWTARLSTPGPGTVGNVASSATDGSDLFVSTNGGLLHRLDGDTGRILWVAKTGVSAFNPIALANGVVYALGADGILTGHDAADGLPLWVTSMQADSQKVCAAEAGGIAVAHHTVIANCDGTLVAYRLPQE